MDSPFNILITELSNMVNKSQYFNPFFSWVIIVYTYFSIGIHGGKVWKYLFYFATCGFIASMVNTIFTISSLLNLDQMKYLNLFWVEHFFWGVNEWGYMYINFLKIKTCISKLNKKIWETVLCFVLIYTIAIRMIITYLDINGRKAVIEKNKKIGGNEKYDYGKSAYYNCALYLPLGILCTIFVCLIFQKFASEQNKNKRSIFSVILHSTLARMLFVSLLFIGMSIIVFFKSNGITGFIRNLLWATKGDLGIIFLVDILLLRIDFDKNKLLEKERQIQMNNDNSLNAIDIESTVSPVSQKANINMEYTNKLLSKSKSINDLYKSNPLSKGIRDDALPYLNPSNVDISKNTDFTDSSYENNQYMTHYPRNNKMPDNYKMGTTPPLSNSNNYYDKPSTSSVVTANDSSYYYNSLPRKEYNYIDSSSIISNSVYNSMSRLHPKTISAENLAPSSVSSNYGSLTRSLSVKGPNKETIQVSLTHSASGKVSNKETIHGSLPRSASVKVSKETMYGSLSRAPSGKVSKETLHSSLSRVPSGKVPKNTYPGSLNRSQSGRSTKINNEPIHGSLKRKHPGDIVMENPTLEE